MSEQNEAYEAAAYHLCRPPRPKGERVGSRWTCSCGRRFRLSFYSATADPTYSETILSQLGLHRRVHVHTREWNQP